MPTTVSRLRGASDFQRVYREGRTRRSGPLLIRTYQSGLPESRLGVVVSRKVSKLAPRRNRLRRQVREYWRKAEDRAVPGLDIIVTVLHDEDLSPQTLEEAFKQARILQ